MGCLKSLLECHGPFAKSEVGPEFPAHRGSSEPMGPNGPLVNSERNWWTTNRGFEGPDSEVGGAKG